MEMVKAYILSCPFIGTAFLYKFNNQYYLLHKFFVDITGELWYNKHTIRICFSDKIRPTEIL